MKITAKTDLPAVISSVALTFPPDSDLFQKPISKNPSNRKYRTAGGGFRLRREGLPAPAKRGSRPETPQLRWKFGEGKEEEKDGEIDGEKSPEVDRNSRRKVRDLAAVSARKLASGLWRLRPPEARGHGGGELCKLSNGIGVQPVIDLSGIHSPARHVRKSQDSQTKEVPQTPNSVSGSRNKFRQKFEPRFHFSNSAMEGATKWDPSSWKAASEDVKQANGESKKDLMSKLSVLESELEQARARIHDLETERLSSKKKLEQFLKKLNEERSTWRSREHEKIRAVIDDVKCELNRERKNRQKTEIVNSKLVNELADAKLSAKRYRQEYEKERKARELIEEVCDELAKEIGEDKAEVEALKRESMAMREDIDDERKMLQMAEVWREERVQMKLVDAKVALESKYSQMNMLVTNLDAFLKSNVTNLDAEEMKRAEMLKKSAASVNIQEIVEFNYEPPNPDDIFSAFDDVNFEPAKVHAFNPETDMFNKDNVYFVRHGEDEDADDNDDDDEDDDDESGWETVSRLEDQGSNYSPNGSDPSVTNVHHETPIAKVGEVCSKQPKKASSISRFLRSENYKIISMEGSNGAALSPDRSSGLSPSDLGEPWSSPDSANPHVTKGCIEWPRAVTQKTSLKSKLLEARVESQKIQLRQVLKQKI